MIEQMSGTTVVIQVTMRPPVVTETEVGTQKEVGMWAMRGLLNEEMTAVMGGVMNVHYMKIGGVRISHTGNIYM